MNSSFSKRRKHGSLGWKAKTVYALALCLLFSAIMQIAVFADDDVVLGGPNLSGGTFRGLPYTFETTPYTREAIASEDSRAVNSQVTIELAETAAFTFPATYTGSQSWQTGYRWTAPFTTTIVTAAYSARVRAITMDIYLEAEKAAATSGSLGMILCPMPVGYLGWYQLSTTQNMNVNTGGELIVNSAGKIFRKYTLMAPFSIANYTGQNAGATQIYGISFVLNSTNCNYNGKIYYDNMGFALDEIPVLNTISYSVNGSIVNATTLMGQRNVYVGHQFTLARSEGLAAPSGSVFKEWNTAADGSGTAYADGAIATMPTIGGGSTSMTLYAIWDYIALPYDVTYDLNGGSGTTPPKQEGEIAGLMFDVATATGLIPPSAPAGLTFKEWNTSADGLGDSFAAGAAAIMPGRDITLFAIWAVPYTVSFDANSGTGAVPAQEAVHAGALFTVPAPDGLTPPAGKVFYEWNTQPDGSGTSYMPSDSFTMPASNLTLSAIWENIHSVVYYVNGGTGTAPTQADVMKGAQFTVAQPDGITPPANQRFKEWNTDPAAGAGGVAYAPGEVVTMPDNPLALYAIWEDDKYSLTYNLNNGKGTAPASADVFAGAKFLIAPITGVEPPNPTKIFKEWNTAANGGGVAYAPSDEVTMPADDLTLYAIWASVPGPFFDAAQPNRLQLIDIDVSGTITDSPYKAQLNTIKSLGTIDGPKQLRGMNLYALQWGGTAYLNDESFKAMKYDWGVNVVRPAMYVHANESYGTQYTYATNPSLRLADIETAIQLGIANEMYIMVDWHVLNPGDPWHTGYMTAGLTAPYFDNMPNRFKELANANPTWNGPQVFFAYLAEKYGSSGWLIYDPANEPNGDNNPSGTPNMSLYGGMSQNAARKAVWSGYLKPYFESVIDVIRQFDPYGIVVCGTTSYSQDPDGVVGDPIDDPNTMYVVHLYAGSHDTTDYSVNYAPIEAPISADSMRGRADYALANGLAVFIGEFGASNTGSTTIATINNAIGWHKYIMERNLSWAHWHSGSGEGFGALSSNVQPTYYPDLGYYRWPESRLSNAGRFYRSILRLEDLQYYYYWRNLLTDFGAGSTHFTIAAGNPNASLTIQSATIADYVGDKISNVSASGTADNKIALLGVNKLFGIYEALTFDVYLEASKIDITSSAPAFVVKPVFRTSVNDADDRIGEVSIPGTAFHHLAASGGHEIGLGAGLVKATVAIPLRVGDWLPNIASEEEIDERTAIDVFFDISLTSMTMGSDIIITLPAFATAHTGDTNPVYVAPAVPTFPTPVIDLRYTFDSSLQSWVADTAGTTRATTSSMSVSQAETDALTYPVSFTPSQNSWDEAYRLTSPNFTTTQMSNAIGARIRAVTMEVFLEPGKATTGNLELVIGPHPNGGSYWYTLPNIMLDPVNGGELIINSEGVELRKYTLVVPFNVAENYTGDNAGQQRLQRIMVLLLGSSTNYTGNVYYDNIGFVMDAPTTQHTVTYDLNGGSMKNGNGGGSGGDGGAGDLPAQRIVYRGLAFTVANSYAAERIAPPEAGLAFAGWNTAADGLGGTAYAAGSTVVATNKNLTLYAMWAPIYYTISLRAYDGSYYSGYTQQVIYGGSIDWDEIRTNYSSLGSYTWDDIYVWLDDDTGDPLPSPDMPIYGDITLIPRMYPDNTAIVSINGPASVISGPGVVASYTISAKRMPLVSAIELEFEVDGRFLSSKDFETMVGFEFFGTGNYNTPIYWKNNGDIWTGKVTLLDLSAVGTSGEADILTMTFNVAEGALGMANAKLNYIAMSYGNGVSVPTMIIDDVATTTFEQYYSPYDVNKDGVIDLNDITFALQYITVEQTDAAWVDAYICDVDPNGVIDIDDLVLILANYTVPYYM